MTYQTAGWDTLRMDYRDPFRELDPAASEIAVVDGALRTLQDAGITPHSRYDHDRFSAHREAVWGLLEIPWTAISLRSVPEHVTRRTNSWAWS